MGRSPDTNKGLVTVEVKLTEYHDSQVLAYEYVGEIRETRLYLRMILWDDTRKEWSEVNIPHRDIATYLVRGVVEPSITLNNTGTM